MSKNTPSARVSPPSRGRRGRPPKKKTAPKAVSAGGQKTLPTTPKGSPENKGKPTSGGVKPHPVKKPEQKPATAPPRQVSPEQRSNEMLDRIARLRLGMVEIMQRCWPDRLRELENALGGRLNEHEDELIVLYLQAFCAVSAQHPGLTGPDQLIEVRKALRDCGISLDPKASDVECAVTIRNHLSAAGQRKRKKARMSKTPNAGSSTTGPVGSSLGWAEPSAGGVSRNDEGEPITLEDIAKKASEDACEDIYAVGDGFTSEDVAAINNRLGIAEPVFMSDLVDAVRDVAAVDAWEVFQREHRSGGVSLVRPKDRDMHRGALVLQGSTRRGQVVGFAESPWGRAIDSGMPAGELYRAALVLRSIMDRVILSSYSNSMSVWTVREAQGRSVVVLLQGGTDVKDVCAAVSKASEGDFNSVTVVCPNPGRLDDVAAALRSSGSRYGWGFNSPLGVADLRTWLTAGAAGAKEVFD